MTGGRWTLKAIPPGPSRATNGDIWCTSGGAKLGTETARGKFSRTPSKRRACPPAGAAGTRGCVVKKHGTRARHLPYMRPRPVLDWLAVPFEAPGAPPGGNLLGSYMYAAAQGVASLEAQARSALER